MARKNNVTIISPAEGDQDNFFESVNIQGENLTLYKNITLDEYSNKTIGFLRKLNKRFCKHKFDFFKIQLPLRGDYT